MSHQKIVECITMLCVHVKRSQETYNFELESDATIDDLRCRIRESTNVEESRQKLVYKGKVLGNSACLSDIGVKTGAKIMLIVTTESQTKGQVALQKSTTTRLEAARAKLQQRLATKEHKPVSLEGQLENWRKLKIIPLRDRELKEFPLCVLQLGESSEVADFSVNAIPSIPSEVHQLGNLRVLNLRNNRLTSDGIPDSLFKLHQLEKLQLDGNELASLSPCISRLTQLRLLTASKNRLTQLPDVFGGLEELSVVECAQNKLVEVPPSLGSCKVLRTLDLSSNRITHLPESFSKLLELRFLRLNDNSITEIQPSLLKGCEALVMLSLHGNGIQLRELRETEGFEEYEERRRGYYDKRLDSDSLQFGEGFDEGIDNDLTQRYNHKG